MIVILSREKEKGERRRRCDSKWVERVESGSGRIGSRSPYNLAVPR